MRKQANIYQKEKRIQEIMIECNVIGPEPVIEYNENESESDHPMIDTSNNLNAFRMNFETYLQAYKYRLAAAFIKIVINLFSYGEDCGVSTREWLVLMGISDLVNLIYLKQQNSIQIIRKSLRENKNESTYQLSGRASYYQELLKEVTKLQQSKNSVIPMYRVDQLNHYLYLALLIWGYFIQTDSKAFVYLFMIINVAMAYKIVFYYLENYNLNALLYIHLKICYKRIHDLSPYKSKVSQNVLICCLCDDSMQYQTMIQLPCDISHLFHKDCLQKWMNAHQYCPVCNYSYKIFT